MKKIILFLLIGFLFPISAFALQAPRRPGETIIHPVSSINLASLQLIDLTMLRLPEPKRPKIDIDKIDKILLDLLQKNLRGKNVTLAIDQTFSTTIESKKAKVTFMFGFNYDPDENGKLLGALYPQIEFAEGKVNLSPVPYDAGNEKSLNAALNKAAFEASDHLGHLIN